MRIPALIFLAFAGSLSAQGAREVSTVKDGRFLMSTPAWTYPTEFLSPKNPKGAMAWPEVRAEARPGAYWWWPGNAVTKRDLTWNLETYRRAGWGNLGVIGIYGVKGEEERTCVVEWSPGRHPIRAPVSSGGGRFAEAGNEHA